MDKNQHFNFGTTTSQGLQTEDRAFLEPNLVGSGLDNIGTPSSITTQCNNEGDQDLEGGTGSTMLIIIFLIV